MTHVTAALAQGPRDEQQDVIYFETTADRTFAIVCDGMGGHDDGRLAAETAVKTIRDLHPTTAKELLSAFLCANYAVRHATGAGSWSIGGGTTGSAVLVEGKRVHVAHVGDSRVGFFRNDGFTWITTKQSVRGGLLAWIGMDPDAFNVEELTLFHEPGDVLVLVSDGITKVLKDPDDLRGDAPAILARAEAKGLKDNTAVIVVEVG